MLHVSTSQPELGHHHNGIFRRRANRRHHHSIISQLASLKHWFVESAKRARSPHSKSPGSGGMPLKFLSEKSSPPKSQDSGKKQTVTTPTTGNFDNLPTPTQKRASNASSLAPSSASFPTHRNSFPRQPRPLNVNTSHHRNSLSPSPITPRSSYRRSSAGLHGRKSTSSSVSSIRSIHHVHTHSKASSASSNSLDTVSTPTASAKLSKSPHSSVKVLPTTPDASARFPSNIRLVRGPFNGSRDGNETAAPIRSIFNEAVPAPLISSPASGLVFARRKRSAFKGPMIHTANLMASGGMGTPTFPGSEGPGNVKTRPRTRKSQIIEEEEDVEDEHEDVDSPSVVEGTVIEGAGKSEDDGDDKGKGPQKDHKPVLAPAPELGSSPIRPPRSSSQRDHELDGEPGFAISTEAGEDTSKDPKTPTERVSVT